LPSEIRKEGYRELTILMNQIKQSNMEKIEKANLEANEIQKKKDQRDNTVSSPNSVFKLMHEL